MLDTVRWITAEGRVLDGPAEELNPFPGRLRIIDQTRLPYDFAVARLTTVEEAAHAIRVMQVRGVLLDSVAPVADTAEHPGDHQARAPGAVFDVQIDRHRVGQVHQIGQPQGRRVCPFCQNLLTGENALSTPENR